MENQRNRPTNKASVVVGKKEMNSNVTRLNGFAERRYPAREELLDSYNGERKLIIRWNLKIE